MDIKDEILQLVKDSLANKTSPKYFIKNKTAESTTVIFGRPGE